MCRSIIYRSYDFVTPPSTSQVALGLQYQSASFKPPIVGQGELYEPSKVGIQYIPFHGPLPNVLRYRIISLPPFRDLITTPRTRIRVAKLEAAPGVAGISISEIHVASRARTEVNKGFHFHLLGNDCP